MENIFFFSVAEILIKHWCLYNKDILQIQGLSIDGLNNRENTTIQYIEYTNIKHKQIYLG